MQYRNKIIHALVSFRFLQSSILKRTIQMYSTKTIIIHSSDRFHKHKCCLAPRFADLAFVVFKNNKSYIHSHYIHLMRTPL